MYVIIVPKGSDYMLNKIVNIRMNEELYDYLKDRAEQEHRTLSNLIISILSDERERTKQRMKPRFPAIVKSTNTEISG